MRRQDEWSFGVKPKGGKFQYLYVPSPKQTEYHEVKLPTIDHTAKRRRINRLYGGAAGPGKSHAIRWDQYRKAATIPNFTGAILRRTMPELRKTHLRSFARDAALIGAQFQKSENQLIWENGSIIECGHCEDDDAVQKWLSTEYDQIDLDEGSTFQPDMTLEISTRARSSKPLVRAAGGPWFGVSTNPGGPSWPLLCDLFVTHTPDYDAYPQLRGKYDPRYWVYIKALLDDNPYLDEGYADDLAVLSEARYRQLRWGEEFVTDGAFFSSWRATKDGEPWHVRSVEIDPTTVEWFASMDWGYNSTGVVLWWAVLPDGRFHIAREWKFREKTAAQVAAEITATTTEMGIRKLRYVACDPSMRRKDGTGRGESIYDTLVRYRLPMRASDNDRPNGWARCQQLLSTRPSGEGPWLTVEPRCVYGIRTMPAQVQDKREPDDLDTHGDDHWADALRYGAMSRPMFTGRKDDTFDEEPPKGSMAWWRRWHARAERPQGILNR